MGISEKKYRCFDKSQLVIVNQAATMAEELVSNYYKISPSQWKSPKYDIKTLKDLTPEEIIDGPFAQIIRYQGSPRGSALGSGRYDFYKVCLQDHTILQTLTTNPNLKLLPFCLYIIVHELIHIVRFSRFLQNFEATRIEKLQEERRVHGHTRAILNNVKMNGLYQVLAFFAKWHEQIDDLATS